MEGLTRVLSRLDREKTRFRVYGLIALGFFALAIIMGLLKAQFDLASLNFVVSDGRGYYVYLPSVVIDHDLDFANQVTEHWDVDFNPKILEEKTPLGLVRNKYPVGLSLSLLPSFLLAHGASRLITGVTEIRAFRPDGYSVLYQLFAIVTIMLMGLASMMMTDRILQTGGRVRGSAIGVAVITFWLGSHYAYYYFREPVMVHVVSTFWVMLSLVSGMRCLGRFAGKDFLLMSLAFSLALVCRPTNVFLAPFVGYVIWRARSSEGIQRTVLLALPAVIPVALQMSVWKSMTGHWLSYSYQDEGFINWASPFLVSTLFSSRHGLFFWSPVLLFSVAGLASRIRARGLRGDVLLSSLLLGFLILWYFNASWHSWWFGDAFGGRAFLELMPLFVMGLAFFFDGFARMSKGQRILAGACVMVALGYNYLLMALYIGHKIPRADYLF